MPYTPKYLNIDELAYAELKGARARQLITGLEFRYSNGATIDMEASYTNARIKVFKSVYDSNSILTADSYTDLNNTHAHPHGYTNSNVALAFHQSHLDIDIPDTKMDIPAGSYTFQLDFKRSLNVQYETAVVGTLMVLPSGNGE